ncbi:MAG: hypothetical protein HYT88_07410, partial [Candidatus Omnitrophica bacterium]|nr:hypothetical protein [Candidatus Omnitrophota bacterium]
MVRLLRGIVFLSFILVALLYCFEARAQEFSEQSPASLESFLQEALSHNSSLESSRHLQEAARHRIPQSWALPDPTAGYMVMGDMLETRLGPQE